MAIHSRQVAHVLCALFLVAGSDATFTQAQTADDKYELQKNIAGGVAKNLESARDAAISYQFAREIDANRELIQRKMPLIGGVLLTGTIRLHHPTGMGEPRMKDFVSGSLHILPATSHKQALLLDRSGPSFAVGGPYGVERVSTWFDSEKLLGVKLDPTACREQRTALLRLREELKKTEWSIDKQQDSVIRYWREVESWKKAMASGVELEARVNRELAKKTQEAQKLQTRQDDLRAEVKRLNIDKKGKVDEVRHLRKENAKIREKFDADVESDSRGKTQGPRYLFDAPDVWQGAARTVAEGSRNMARRSEKHYAAINSYVDRHKIFPVLKNIDDSFPGQKCLLTSADFKTFNLNSKLIQSLDADLGKLSAQIAANNLESTHVSSALAAMPGQLRNAHSALATAKAVLDQLTSQQQTLKNRQQELQATERVARTRREVIEQSDATLSLCDRALNGSVCTPLSMDYTRRMFMSPSRPLVGQDSHPSANFLSPSRPPVAPKPNYGRP